MLSNHLILCHPFFLAFSLSQHQDLFQWICSLNQVAKVLELQLSISPSSECLRLMSFKIDWFDILAVQWIFKSLLQQHNSLYICTYGALSVQFSSVQFSSVQLLNHVQLFGTPWTATCQASLPITNAQSLLKLMSIECVMPSNHFVLCHPLLLLPSIILSISVFSIIQFFTSGGQSIGVSASASVLPMNIQGWFPLVLTLLAVWGTLQSLLQHHSSKASIIQRSFTFLYSPTLTYMTTGKTIALTRQTFVKKVTSLLFSILSRLVITFPPRSKHLLIL